MSGKNLPATISRRNFLKIAGAAACALTFPSQLLAFGDNGTSLNFSGWPAVRLGMLLPEQDISAVLTKNFLAGFDYCLKTSGCLDAGVSIELVRADSGGAVSVSALKKLVQHEQVSLVTGVLNTAAASALRSFTRDEEFLLMTGSAGECIARQKNVSPNTFNCSMNFWQANWTMGRWAASHMGRKSVVATSVYETGYDTLEAFRLGFQSAGGTVGDTFVADTGKGTPDFDKFFSEASSIRPDFIYALYSGQLGVDFIKAYTASGLAGRIPLACSSHLLTGDVIKSMGPLAAGVKTCLPWHSDLFAPGTVDFARNYRKETGLNLDSFGLLGYDTAGIILSALSVTNGKTGNIKALARAFETAGFSSPRGQVTMNPKTNVTRGPLFIHEVGMAGGAPFSQAIDRCTVPGESDKLISSLWASERSGWYNAYLYA